MSLSSLLIQEVETPFAMTLPISEDISIVSTTSLEVAAIQNLRVGSPALAHAEKVVEMSNANRNGFYKSDFIEI